MRFARPTPETGKFLKRSDGHFERKLVTVTIENTSYRTAWRGTLFTTRIDGGELEKKLRALLEKGISCHRGPRRTVFSSRSIQFPARTGVAFGLINTCRRCKQVFDPYICQERSGEWCSHGARNLLFQESIEDEASICFFSSFPELAETFFFAATKL